MTSLSTSIPSQLAIASYLEFGGFDRHLRHLRTRLEDNSVNALRAITQYFPKGSKATRPQGGYFLWVELPHNINALEVHQRAIKNGISVAPGNIFSGDQRFSHHLRLNYGLSNGQALELAIQSLAECLDPA